MQNAGLQFQRISDLVEQDNVRAYVLYYLGIRFYEYSEHTLQQVCEEKGLKLQQVVRELEQPAAGFREAELPLISCPTDLIIEYLKHAHYLFVKHRLPYISKLVQSFKAPSAEFEGVEKDMKLLFPLFVEDFIHHIYQEEDTLFTYIGVLERAKRGHFHPSRLYYQMEKNSLQRFALEHEAHDDEMEGIRKITKDYLVHAGTPLLVKVIYRELQDFEKNLTTHARIENDILFPKAMALENEVRQQLASKIKLN